VLMHRAADEKLHVLSTATCSAPLAIRTMILSAIGSSKQCRCPGERMRIASFQKAVRAGRRPCPGRRGRKPVAVGSVLFGVDCVRVGPLTRNSNRVLEEGRRC